MGLLPWLWLVVPWSGCLLSWRRGWFGTARFLAVCGSFVLAQVAAYHWQAYDRAWAMAVPFVVGMFVVAACGRAKGEGPAAAAWTALAAVGGPIFLMLVTYPYFHELFEQIRADSSVRRVVHWEGKDPPVSELAAALANDDPWVRWGALHQLWLSGPAAIPAAEAVARAVVAAPDSSPADYLLRKDGSRFLASLGKDGVPGLLILLKEGDKDLQRDALYAISSVGPSIKALVLPDLVTFDENAAQDFEVPLKRAREALAVTRSEWPERLRLATPASPPPSRQAP